VDPVQAEEGHTNLSTSAQHSVELNEAAVDNDLLRQRERGAAAFSGAAGRFGTGDSTNDDSTFCMK